MSTIEIFPARLEMAEIMAAHHAKSFSEGWSAEAFARMLSLPGTFAFIVAALDASAGFVLARTAGEESEILTIAVDPERRRHGLGRKLLVAAMDEARKRGAQEMFLEVADDNRAALTLYRAAGFSDVGTRAGYYSEGGKLRDALTLKRSI